MTPRFAAVVLAGGSGSRVGASVNKVLLPLAGRPVLAHSLATARAVGADPVVAVVRRHDLPALAGHLDGVTVVDGGARRHDSEWAALQALASAIDAGRLEVVAIHDGARPLASQDLWRSVLDAAAECGGALPGRPVGGVLGRDGRSAGDLVAVQTPQAFWAPALLAAYRAAGSDGFAGTDTAACWERYGPGLPVRAVPAPATNLKITFPEDVALAERLVSPRTDPPRSEEA